MKGSIQTPKACNSLLAALPEATQQRLKPKVELVALKSKQVVHRRSAPLRHAYFPCDGLISVTMPSNGKSVEVGMIGNDGFFGLPVLFGTESCPMTAFCQVAGEAIRLKARDFQELLQTDERFASLMNRYAQAYSVMVAQGSACHNAHGIEQRCSKWLLMAHDRLGVDEFPMTQESLAQTLGVRRSTVSEQARMLQDEGLIQYRQGRMTILSRQGLEELTCNCYHIIRAEFDRIFRSAASV